MQLNADFSSRVVTHSADLEWTESPIPGVHRKMLDRMGLEVARATSIVRYAPHSQFSPHVHTGGEEFIVLEGIFQDEHGDYPVGSYVRNPPESKHTPGSETGCTIFVKLWQFDPSDRTPVVTNMNDVILLQDVANDSVKTFKLFQDQRETVTFQHWNAGASVTLPATGGLELFVLEGSFTEQSDQLVKHSWLRVPDGETVQATVGPNSASVWIKTGHLRFAEAPRRG